MNNIVYKPPLKGIVDTCRVCGKTMKIGDKCVSVNRKIHRKYYCPRCYESLFI